MPVSPIAERNPTMEVGENEGGKHRRGVIISSIVTDNKLKAKPESLQARPCSIPLFQPFGINPMKFSKLRKALRAKPVEFLRASLIS
jgi:hypothetical protein